MVVFMINDGSAKTISYVQNYGEGDKGHISVPSAFCILHYASVTVYFQFLLLVLMNGSLPHASASKIKVKFSTSFATEQFMHPLHNTELPCRNSCTAKNKFAQSFPPSLHPLHLVGYFELVLINGMLSRMKCLVSG